MNNNSWTFIGLFAAIAVSLNLRAASLEKVDSTAVDSGKPVSSVPVATDTAKPPAIAARPADSTKIIVYKEDGDTVFMVRMHRARDAFLFAKNCAGTFTKRGFGVGGGPEEGLFAVDIRPFSDLAGRVAPLRGKSFPFGSMHYQPFFMSGGLGFIGIGNGLRLGGGGMSGERHFLSRPGSNDSAINFCAKINWGGFLIEKSVMAPAYTYIVGGNIGGGAFDASWTGTGEGYSIFTERKSSDSDKGIKASFGYFEVHGGLTYHVLPFMHLSGDLSVPLLISTDGFAPFTQDFISVCPGLRLRLIFGNLG